MGQLIYGAVHRSIMKTTTIIILTFYFASAIGRGVKEIRLATGNWIGCGGVNIGIKIQSGRNECIVIPKPQIFGNSIATWSGTQLGNCASFNVDENSRVYFQTDSSTDGFCPDLLQIYMDDRVNTRYHARANYYVGYYTNDHNNYPNGVTKEWPKGVKEIRLATGNWLNCGGVNIGIKIQSGRNDCIVIPKPKIFGNSIATWSGAQLGNCASFNVDESSRVYFQTDSSTDGFCPDLLQIYTDDRVNTRYHAKGNYYVAYYTNDHNNFPSGVTKEWPKMKTNNSEPIEI